MGVNHRLENNGFGAALILRHTITDQQCSFQIGAFTQQIFHQWIGLEEVPLVIGGAIPKSLQGIGNGHNRINHRRTTNDWVNYKTAHKALVDLFGLLLDFNLLDGQYVQKHPPQNRDINDADAERDGPTIFAMMNGVLDRDAEGNRKLNKEDLLVDISGLTVANRDD